MPSSNECDTVAHERELREQWQIAHEQRHESEAAALVIARSDVNRRLDEMNELRRQIDTERGKYMDRETYVREHTTLRESMAVRIDTLRDTLDTRLKALENTKSNLEGRVWAIGAGISAMVVALQLILHYWGGK